MNLNDTNNPNQEKPVPATTEAAAGAPAAPRIWPIAELIEQPDFPQGIVGRQVDIGGFLGVVTDLVRNSIRVRPAQGMTMSYNINVLRKLYGRVTHEPIEPEPAPPPEAPPAAPPPPKREIITEPDFNAPLQPIEKLVNHPDFPRNVYGKFIDLHGYEGVVVEIVGRSLKVRSRQGSTHSYNADGLRRLYGSKPQG